MVDEIKESGLYRNKQDRRWEIWDCELFNIPILLGFCDFSLGEEGFKKFEEDYKDYWIDGYSEFELSGFMTTYH